jgi:hypothetical protein
MKKTFYGRNELIAEAKYLEIMGHDFIDSALELFNKKEETQEWSKHIYSFNLLAAQAVEILPKSLIAVHLCLNKNNYPIDATRCLTRKELGQLGHRLDLIFKKVPKLKKKLKIYSIKRISNIFLDEYVLTINNKKVSIKYLEGARYGAFATNSNLLSCYNNNVPNFLKELSDATKELITDMINDFDDKKNNI